ncbi:MAG: TIGR00153 family protein [Deltaproteobacteria bacterium]|nr:TIGR00153 family protein [Deltaproteobacteria bacterium]MBW1919374.1 TIGR00153 family protein [Deltaproteobacteria bacterium]MBW1936010.1 TIGR00153 family protein [Deltaproteobacteria bacterium]MBW1977412.1 TIGR00153 family protein [Deltaproteobacteria bacterium]MBW2043861.1 TIGR00153 family protein [Deltaproteobacteria bacterium]
MRTTFMYLFYKSPFENLKRHADKVSECARMFSKAVDCHLDKKCEEFDNLTDEVARLESEADAIKRNIRGHMPRGILMPVDKFQFFMYLREQDKVLDSVEESLYWLSYRPQGVEDEIGEDLEFLVSKVVPTIEKLSPLVDMAMRFFKGRYKEERVRIKSLIRDIRQQEHEADHLERELIHKIFTTIKDPLQVFFLVRLVETIGSIADHAQNASDMMRAMIAE